MTADPLFVELVALLMARYEIDDRSAKAMLEAMVGGDVFGLPGQSPIMPTVPEYLPDHLANYVRTMQDRRRR